MSIQERTRMIEQLINEEGRLGIGSRKFLQRHNEIMEAADHQLLKVLVMEQREGE